MSEAPDRRLVEKKKMMMMMMLMLPCTRRDRWSLPRKVEKVWRENVTVSRYWHSPGAGWESGPVDLGVMRFLSSSVVGAGRDRTLEESNFEWDVSMDASMDVSMNLTNRPGSVLCPGCTYPGWQIRKKPYNLITPSDGTFKKRRGRDYSNGQPGSLIGGS